MKKRLYNFFIGGRKFKKEFKKQARLLVIITLGFTIAFTWRQTIFDLSQELVKLFVNIQNSATLSILASIIINMLWAWEGPSSDLTLGSPGFDSPQVHSPKCYSHLTNILDLLYY